MKYTKLKTILCLVLSVIILTSCSLERYNNQEGASDGAATETDKSPSQEVPEDEKVYRYSGNPDYPVLAKAYLDALPTIDFDGATFFITSPDVSFIKEDEIYIMSDTVAKRNKQIEEKYNIKLQTSRADSDFMLDDAKQAAMAGMYYTNIMCIPLGDVGVFEAEGLLMNLRSLPHLDTSMPYFNQSSVSALSAGNRLYGIAGEANPATDLPCVIYNKAIAEDLSLPDLYSLALDGGFTWDKLFELSALVDVSSGKVGAAITGGKTYEYIFGSLGEKYVSSGDMKIPVAGIVNYSMDWTATYSRQIIRSAEEAGITKDNAVESFADGKVLFTIGNVNDLDDYRTPDVQIGILPMPKAKLESPYRSSVGKNALVMTVPEGSTSSNMASLVISAINASSYGYMTEAKATYLHVITLPDNRSADILEVISRSAVYEFSTAFESTVLPVFNLKATVRDIIDTGDFKSFDTAIKDVNSALSSKFKLQY